MNVDDNAALYAQIIAYTPNKSTSGVNSNSTNVHQSTTNNVSNDGIVNLNTFKVLNIQANVDIHISCVFVSIKFTYFNVSKTEVNGIFQFPTNNGKSIISDCEISFPKKCFAMSIVDPNNIQIKENKQLRDLSNAMKTRDMSVYDPNIFSMPFHSCPPNTQIIVDLKYFQDLTFTPQGTYDINIPLSLSPHSAMYENMAINDVVSITATIHPGSMNAAACQYGSNTHTLIKTKITNTADSLSTDVTCFQLKAAALPVDPSNINNTFHSQDHTANTKLLATSTTTTNSKLNAGDFNIWYQVRSDQMQATCLIEDNNRSGDYRQFDSNGDEKNKSKNKEKDVDDDSSAFILFVSPPSLPSVTTAMSDDDRDMIASAPAEVLPRRAVFLLDHSGSMTGPPLSDAKRCLVTALQHLQPCDEFAICAFDDDMIWFNGNNSSSDTGCNNNYNKGYDNDHMLTATAIMNQPRLVSGSAHQVQQACKWVESVKEYGATDILTPYRLASECLTQASNSNSSFISMIVLITDGAVPNEVEICKYTESLVNMAVATAATVIATPLNNTSHNNNSSGKYKILKSNKVGTATSEGEEQEYYPPSPQATATAVASSVPHVIRTHTFGIGPYCNRYFLKILAERGRGQSDVALYSDTLTSQMHSFMRKTQQPVVTDIDVQMSGVPLNAIQCYPRRPPDLSVGCPLIIAGTFTSANQIPTHIQFSGRSATSPSTSNTSPSSTMMVYPVTIVSAPTSMPLRRLVEKIKLDFRIAEWWLEQNETERQKLKESIVTSAVAYQIPCVFTQTLAYEVEPVDLAGATADNKNNSSNNDASNKKNRHKNMTRALLATGAVVLGTCIVAEFAFGSISATAGNLGIFQAMGSLAAGGFDSGIFSTIGAAFESIDLSGGVHAIGSAAGTVGGAIGNVAGDAVDGVTHTFNSIDVPNCNCCCCCCDVPCPFPSPLVLFREHNINCSDLPCCCCCPSECNDVCQQGVGLLMTASQFVFHFCSDNCAVCGNCECIGSVLGSVLGFFDNCACVGQLLGQVNQCNCCNDICGVCQNCECVGQIIQVVGLCISSVIAIGGDMIGTCCNAMQGCDNCNECGGMCVAVGGEVVRGVGPCIQSIGPIANDIIGCIGEILR